MSDESLSQNQVESLLRAMEGIDDDAAAAPAPPQFTDEAPPETSAAPGAVAASQGVEPADAPAVAQAASAKPGSTRRSKRKYGGKPLNVGVGDARVMAYDFKRPERVGK
ncbi:MAG: flagellar motor switch protein FliM, partial [Planctomycetota bacterium]